jgi:hypothetical protein
VTKITVIGALLLSFASAIAQNSNENKNANPVPPNHEPSELGSHQCDGSRFPMKLPTGPAVPVSCCRGRDGVMVHIGRTKQTVGFRLPGTPCSMHDGSTLCSLPGKPQCEIGPCGASVEGFTVDTATPPGTDAHVFRPKHAVKACGYHAEIGTNQFSFYPERYDDHNPQPDYPKVTPSCPYTACLGHRPGITITAKGVENGASGHVESHPPGLSVSGADTGSQTFADPVTLSAFPKSSDARAVISGGGCDSTGQYGKKVECSVPLTPDPEVTVTYQCKPGASCE